MRTAQVRTIVRPHTSDPATLTAQRQIYSRSQTPVQGPDGTVRALDLRPAGPETAGRHLDEISSRYGAAGVARTMHGLTATRGWSFAEIAVKNASTPVRHSAVRAIAASLGPVEGNDEQAVFAAASSIRQSQPSGGLPPQVSAGLPPAARAERVRLHDDSHAHTAARAVGARAFTVGNDIYMGAGEYQPYTASGQRLLIHETAHTIQQDGTAPSQVERMRLSDPSGREEVEAERFAGAVSEGAAESSMPRRGSASATNLMRAITFARSNDALTTNNPGVQESGAGTFQIANGVPSVPFTWTADVTIHGNAGDNFANFQVGPLQVLRNWWFNVWWGTGANRTHRRGQVATPIRDALTAANTWYADVLASANFGANGDVRNTGLNDSPGIPSTPLANPIVGRVSTRGWFNYGVGFVAYISARDTTTAGAAAFRHLAHVYWNMSLDGTFDTTLPAGNQVTLGAAATNSSRVFSGESAADPPIIGGAVPNTAAVITTT